MEKRKIVIDTDPGIDDAYAISAALLCKEAEVIGITAVAGNKSLPVVTPNALRLVDFFEKTIPVCEGAWAPLKKLAETDPKAVGTADAACHGSDGMGESGLPYSARCLSDKKAWDFILEKADAYPHEVEIVALGPLTNLAVAAQKNAEAMKKLKSITIMGGSFLRRGNITPYSEYNIWFDPDAAETVVQTLGDAVEIRFVGLDATMDCVFSHDEIAFLEYEGGKTGALLAKIVKTYQQAYYRGSGILGAVIHDLYAMMTVLDPTLILDELSTGCHVLCSEAERGRTFIDPNGKSVKAVMKLDSLKLKRSFIQLVMPEKNEIIRRVLPYLY